MARPLDPPMRRRDRRAAERLNRPARRRTRQAARPAWRSPMALVTAAAIALGLGIVLVALPKGSADGEELRFPFVSYAPELIVGEALGSADAPVVMELYSDFQCPACKLFVTGQLHRLVEDFVVPGTLRIEARDIAFLGRGARDESLELAVGARCAAEQDRYWPFHDLVFWNQGRENRGDHSEAYVDRIAAAAGLDAATFATCVDRPDVRLAISSQTRTAAGKGINSTPTLIINGHKVVGVPDYEELAALIRSLANPSAAPGSSEGPRSSAGS